MASARYGWRESERAHFSQIPRAVVPRESPGQPARPVDRATQDREDRREQCGREQDRDRHHHQAGDANALGLGERREQERGESHHHGEARRHHGMPRGRDRPHGSIPRSESGVEFFPEAGDHQERIIDPDAQPDHRDHVQDEDRHRRELRNDPDEGEGNCDRHHADDDWQKRGHQRTERQHQNRQRDRDQLAFIALGVVGADGADVDVEWGAAGDQYAVRVAIRDATQDASKLCPEWLHRLGNGRATDAERDQKEGGSAVAGDERRLVLRGADRQHPPDTGLAPGCGDQRVEQLSRQTLRHPGGTLDRDGEELRDRPGEARGEQRIGGPCFRRLVGASPQFEAIDRVAGPEGRNNPYCRPDGENHPSPSDDGSSQGFEHGTMVGLPSRRR